MAISDEFKRYVKAGNLSEALKLALAELIELKITTWVMPTVDDDSSGSGMTTPQEPQPGYRMMTRINIVDGTIDNEVGSQFLSSGPYAELREFHLSQVQKGREIIYRNLQVLKDLFGTLAVGTSRRYETTQASNTPLSPSPQPILVEEVSPSVPSLSSLDPLMFNGDRDASGVSPQLDNSLIDSSGISPDVDVSVTEAPSLGDNSLSALGNAPSDNMTLEPIVFDATDDSLITAEPSLSEPTLSGQIPDLLPDSESLDPQGVVDLSLDPDTYNPGPRLADTYSPVADDFISSASSVMPTADTNDPTNLIDVGTPDAAGATLPFTFDDLDLSPDLASPPEPPLESDDPLRFDADDLDFLLSGSTTEPTTTSTDTDNFSPLSDLPYPDGDDSPTTVLPDLDLPPLIEQPTAMTSEGEMVSDPDAATAMPPEFESIFSQPPEAPVPSGNESVIPSPWDTPLADTAASISSDPPSTPELSLDELNQLFVDEEFDASAPISAATDVSSSPGADLNLSIEETVSSLFGEASLMEEDTSRPVDHNLMGLDDDALNSLFDDVSTDIFPTTPAESPDVSTVNLDDDNPFADFPS